MRIDPTPNRARKTTSNEMRSPTTACGALHSGIRHARCSLAVEDYTFFRAPERAGDFHTWHKAEAAVRSPDARCRGTSGHGRDRTNGEVVKSLASSSPDNRPHFHSGIFFLLASILTCASRIVP